MTREKKNSVKLSERNEHLLDVFSDDLYLELGCIEYEPLNNLLSKKLVDYKDIIYSDILKKGIGSMSCGNDELANMLPFLYFKNLVSKNKAYKHVITYGMMIRRNGYKEYFTPIILIPVKMYFESNTILFQMISKPIINPYIKKDSGQSVENIEFTEKLDNIYNIDKYILSIMKNHTNNIRLENYLTIINTKQSEITLHHELFKLDNHFGAQLTEKYSVDSENTIYNITNLDQTQRNAVAVAHSGNSFALTGYQGTGKTTTLVNIASDFIKQGKRVLYISNNDNTLNTVNEIFKDCKLNSYISDFTLSFDKVNEKNVDIKKGQIFDNIEKQEIKDYYNNIEEIMSNFTNKRKNYLIIELMKELIVTPKPETLFSEKIMKNAYILYKHEIKEIVASLIKIEELMKNIPSFINSHFINIPITHNITSSTEPLFLIEQLFNNFCFLNEEKNILEKNYGFANIKNYALFKNIIKNYFNLNKAIVPVSWYKDQNSESKIDKKFYNYLRARELFEQIKSEIALSKNYDYLLNKKYDLANNEFDVKRAIAEITDKYFEVNDDNINVVLKDYINIENELSKALAYCKDLDNYSNKLNLVLRLTLDMNNTKVIEEVLDCIFVLEKGYFAKAWLDYETREQTYNRVVFIEQILDRYEEAIRVYNKYFDSVANIDAHIKTLIKKNRDVHRKYRGFLINELLPYVHFIKEHHLEIPQLKKEYLELTNAHYEYKVHISDILKEFIDKHHLISDKPLRIELEKSFQKLSYEQIKPLLGWAKDVKKAISNVSNSYEFFSKYNLVANAVGSIDKVNQIRGIIKYVKNVFKWQTKMHRLLKQKRDDVLIDIYLDLSNTQDSLEDINNKINNNPEYKVLYEKLFDGENTNIELLEKIIHDYSSYMEVFENPECFTNSFLVSYNNELCIHLKNSEAFIEEINNQFQNYVKIFKTNISKYYYDDFSKIINHFRVLLNSKEELDNYLAIADEMKVLLQYKLYNLNNYIIYHNHEKFVDRFKYSYFDYLYKQYIKENPTFIDNDSHIALLNTIMNRENDLISNNAEVIISENKIFRTGKAKHLDYNSYILKNKNSKLLFLSDTTIANLFLDMALFDLVIIDDAHMLHANEYQRVVNCKQVVISGNEQTQTSVANNLVSRMRPTSIIRLKYRFAKTPFKLLSQVKDIKGRFYSEIKLNEGISVSKDDYNQVIIDKIHNDVNVKINFFTTSLSKTHKIIQNIGNVLYDKDYSIDEISNVFKNNLNVCDLSLGNFIQSEYNIIDLESYYKLDDQYTVMNYINSLICCERELIILDPKNYLKQENSSLFIKKLKELFKYKLPKPELPEKSVIKKISDSLAIYQIKTICTYDPLHLLVEYDNNYFGIILLENPDNTEFAILNEYREFKSNDLPIIMKWLSEFIYDYDKVLDSIVKEIRS